jgi:two-component system, OmpR family, sensor histidine kinase ArlS
MRNSFLKLGKISWKLTLVYALLFSLVLLVLSAGVLFGVRYYLFQQAYDTVRDSSDETVSRLLDAGDDLDLSDNDLLGEAQVDTEVNISIASPSGTIVNESSNFFLPDNDVKQRPGVIRRLRTGGMHLMVLNTSVMNGNKAIAWIQVALNLESSDNFVEILFVQLAVADSLGIILSVFIGSVVSKRMLNPIDKITKTAQGIDIHDLDSRIPVGSTEDELSRLAVTINAMLGRLKDSVEKQSRFVSDASHELRTPISVILGYAGLLDRWGKDDKKVLQESVDAIKSEALSMRGLTERLLYLARSDGGALKIQREPFCIAELLLELAEECRLVAPGVALSCDSPEGLSLNADRSMIKQMLRDLVDNSVKFTKGSGKILLKAQEDGGQIQISVCDDGIGIPPEEMDSIFDRFYRVDRARSKDTGGSGLGLSIVKSIVDAHEGTIGIDSTPGVGTCIMIKLPNG